MFETSYGPEDDRKHTITVFVEELNVLVRSIGKASGKIDAPQD